MKANLLPTALLVLSLCSCTVYLKDMIKGSPYDRAYERSYDQARASGMSHEQAHRRALLAGGSNHNEVWDRRQREEKEDEEWDELFDHDGSDDDDIEIEWD